MAVARSLVVDIAMNTAKITKDLSKLSGDFDALGSTVKKIGGILGTAFTVKQVINYVDSIIDLGDELSKTSQKIGISVEKLSAYQYAANLSGVSNEELRGSLAKLSKNLQEAATDSGSEAAKMFEVLGVNVKDSAGKVRDISGVFENVADKLAGVRDDTSKTTVEMALFGKSGYELAPLVNNLKELTAEAERTGNIISSDFAKSSEQFNDNLERMEKHLGSLSRTITGPVIKAFNDLYETMTKTEHLDLALKRYGDVRDTLSELSEVARIQEERFGRAEPGLIKRIAELEGEKARLMARILELRKVARESTKDEDKPVLKLPDVVKKSASGKTARSEMEDAFRAEAELGEEYTAQGLTLMARRIMAEEEEKRRLKMEAARNAILDDETIAQEALIKRLKNIQKARDLEIISEADKNILIEEAARDHQAKMGDIEAQGAKARADFEKLTAKQKTEFVLGQIIDMTQGVAANNKTLFQINKAAALANAIISMPEHISRTMAKYPFPLSIAMGALAAAASLAQIKAIKSASFGSATSAPSVGGGGAMPVTNVGASSQPGPTGTQQLPSQNITINIQNGMGDKAYWQGLIDDVIVPGINDARDRNINLNIRTV